MGLSVSHYHLEVRCIGALLTINVMSGDPGNLQKVVWKM